MRIRLQRLLATDQVAQVKRCRDLLKQGAAAEMYGMLARFWEEVLGEEGQGVSEYAVLVVLLILIVVATVHALGENAQQVIDRVNTALHG